MGGAVKSVGKAITSPLGFVANPGIALGAKTLGFGGMGGSGGTAFAPQGQDPSMVLSQNGGAPVLSQIAMGADIDDAIAGYLGVRKAEFLDALNGRNTYLSPQQVQNIKSARAQLTSIQKDRTLRQQAVDKVIADFPNIATEAAKARVNAGGEYDNLTRDAVNQALNGVAAKYAAGGGISSGAANEAFARVGAENINNKINYMNDRENTSYQQGLNSFTTRLNEVNALRDFQNTLLGNGINQGFSANQANLQRQFQGQMQNADFLNQQNLANQNSKNALFGALGSLGGTALGYGLFGPAGGIASGALFGSPVQNTSLNTSSMRPMPPPASSSQYAPYGVMRY